MTATVFPALLTHPLVISLTLAGLALASGAVVVLGEVTRLSHTRTLKRAWLGLRAVLVLCIVLQGAALVSKLNQPVGWSDVAAAAVHVLGPAFVLAVAWLSKLTAADNSRIGRLERDALFDVLTGLRNRRSFEAELRAWTADASPPVSLHLCLLDLDHFKQVNDSHGHRAGDMILSRIGALIAATVEGSGVAYRIGGEEFAVVLPRHGDQAAADAVERLRCVIGDTAFRLATGDTIRVTASIGLSRFRREESFETLLQRADDALYAAKRAGRNRVQLAA